MSSINEKGITMSRFGYSMGATVSHFICGICGKVNCRHIHVKYYYCKAAETSYLYTCFFHITPKEYFDQRGFLSDQFNAVDPKDLPFGFERVSDATFGVIGAKDRKSVV